MTIRGGPSDPSSLPRNPLKVSYVSCGGSPGRCATEPRLYVPVDATTRGHSRTLFLVIDTLGTT